MTAVDSVAEVNGIRVRYVREGSGPLVVLMHGFPETSHCWRHLRPLLADAYTVVAPDMRGYGLSDKPLSGYDKRTMATDLRDLVDALGFDRAALVVGHDRGARVVHRFGLDHPDRVERLVMLDLIPTREVLRSLDLKAAMRYWHWFFHLVPDLPELFIAGNLEAYVRMFFSNAYVRAAVDEAVPEYVSALRRAGALRAALEDYRLTFTDDLRDDDASAAAGQRLTMPTMVLWGEKGLNADRDVMLEIWQRYAEDVRTGAVPECGYYMAEEQPAALAERLRAFLAEPA